MLALMIILYILYVGTGMVALAATSHSIKNELFIRKTHKWVPCSAQPIGYLWCFIGGPAVPALLIGTVVGIWAYHDDEIRLKEEMGFPGEEL